MTATTAIRCGCGRWKGHPDAQSCQELREYGQTPIVRYGDVLDGVIALQAWRDLMAGRSEDAATIR